MADPVLELEGAAAIPRSNGEPVFSAPWQSRAFGMAMALHEAGAFEWDAFRERLIEEVATRECELEDLDGSLYYSCWLAALARVVTDEEMVTHAELLQRELAFRTGLRRDVF